MSARKRSPNATCVMTSETARATAAAMRSSYSSLLVGCSRMTATPAGARRLGLGVDEVGGAPRVLATRSAASLNAGEEADDLDTILPAELM